MVPAFPYLLLPHVWSSRNRVRRRERGDLLRGCLFGAIAVLVGAAILEGSSWLASTNTRTFTMENLLPAAFCCGGSRTDKT
jgi:hypothetical protein